MHELHPGDDGRFFQQFIQRRLHARISLFGYGRVSRLRKAIGAERILIETNQSVATGMPAHYAQAVDGRRRFQGNGQLASDQTRALRAVPQQGEPPPVFLPPRHKAGNLQDTPAIHAKGNAFTWLDLFALQFAAHGVQRFRAAQCREACAQSRKDAGTLRQNPLKILALSAGRLRNDDAAFFYQRIAAVCAVG